MIQNGQGGMGSVLYLPPDVVVVVESSYPFGKRSQNGTSIEQVTSYKLLYLVSLSKVYPEGLTSQRSQSSVGFIMSKNGQQMYQAPQSNLRCPEIGDP